MKIINGDEVVIYLSKSYIKNVNLKDRNVAEDFINKINNVYKIDMCAYLDIKIYVDKYYGVTIVIKKEDGYYLDYFNDEVSMNIEILESLFLYKVDDIFSIKRILDGVKVFEFDNNFYVKVENLSDIKMGILIENSDVVYGNVVNKIMRRSRIINTEVIM